MFWNDFLNGISFISHTYETSLSATLGCALAHRPHPRRQFVMYLQVFMHYFRENMARIFSVTRIIID